MFNLKEKQPALILIDIQKGFVDETYWGGNRNNRNAESNAGILLYKWRELGWPIFHVRHSSVNPNSPLYGDKPGFSFHDAVKPMAGEREMVKHVNAAFIGTDLERELKEKEVETVVIAGMTTNHCVSTSVRMSGNLGFETILVEDATATFDLVGANGKKYDAQLLHDTEIASLKDEFATIVTLEKILAAVD
jgi:nicotinamidase-related amidase